MLKQIFPLVAFALGAVALNETIDGYAYFLSGPKQDQPKTDYEHEAAITALSLLKKRMAEANETLPDLPEDNVAAVLTLKQYLTTSKLEVLLTHDMDDADTFWHDIINNSTSSLTDWKAAKARGVIFLPNVTATSFAAWYASPYADAANLAANPEHYAKNTEQTSTGLSSKILEGWGGVTTNFTIPNFGVPDRASNPFLDPLPEFPIQEAGDKVLRDNTRFGVLHIAVRSVSGSDYGQGIDGFEVYSAVWYPSGVEDDHLEYESRHMINEIVNLTLQAQRDIENGTFTVSS
ncbi:hypothetical protein F4819DRAFT_397953 [Hypoxylon fuscum]|nr:hypothetical protein F4819DRAFT_397953 [Hypoxylon fuscum]